MTTNVRTDDPGFILVMDDEPEVGRLLTKFFRRRGYDVESASTAEEALAALSQRRPDIVLLDVTSTRLGGLSMLERLRKPTHDLSVIAMAKAPDGEEAQQSLKLGATDFMAKPLDLAYLETCMLAEITRRRG